MVELVEANWPAFALALVIGLLVAWWIFARSSSKPAERERRPDVLDEGAAPARRNQALIDAPPAAAVMPPAAAGTMGGIGEAVAFAAQDEVEDIAARRQATEGAASVPETAPETAPVPETVPPAPPAPAGSDDLRRIKGLGPKLVTLLGGLGVTSFAQIAAWDDAEIDRIDAQLGTFAGRIRRDNWVEQARLLSSGDTASYEAKFGKL